MGNFVYENVGGMRAAIDSLAELGSSADCDMRQALVRAMQAIREYETTLSRALLEGIGTIKQGVVYGIKNTKALHQRVPTLCFNVGSLPPEAVSSRLAYRNIAVRHGHMYSPRLIKRLGLTPDNRVVGASLVHHKRPEEV